MIPRKIVWGFAVLAGVGMLLLTPGCIGIDDVRLVRDQADALRLAIEKQVVDVASAAADLPEGDARLEDLQARKAHLEALHRSVSEAVAQADRVLQEVGSPQSPISAIVGAVVPWVPEPARTPLLLGGALLATLVRAGQWRSGLKSVVSGIERAKRQDESFARHFAEHADTFRATQTPLAQKVVDQMTARRQTRIAA